MEGASEDEDFPGTGRLKLVQEIDGLVVTFRSDPEGDDGWPKLSTAGVAGHQGNELALYMASFGVDSLSSSQVQFHYAQPTLGLQLTINSQHLFGSAVAELDGIILGGVSISVDHASFEGGSRGVVTFNGPVEQFWIAGDLYIDHICGIGGGGSPPETRGILADLPCLSQAARDSLVAHFDGRTGVVTVDGSSDVSSWTPLGAAGTPISEMALTSVPRAGGGAPSLIAYRGSGTLSFDDSRVEGEGRFLDGFLTNSGGTEMTVVWYGHYDAGALAEDSGAYAFNIGLNELSHQRDNLTSGGFTVKIHNGATYPGTVDITPFDGIDTVWTTRVSVGGHSAFAGGTDLDIQGSPTYRFGAEAEIVLGGSGPSGFDFIGDMKQLVIFESALSETDRLLLQDYFEGGLVPIIPQPPTVTEVGGMFEITWRERNVVLQRSTDLIHWASLPDAVSPLTVPPPAGGREYYRLACGG